MKKLSIIAVLIALFAFPANIDAQSFLKKLADRATDRAKYKVERKVEDAVDNAVDSAEDEATDAVKGKKGKKGKNNDEEVEAADENPQVATSSDFKRGSVIMFQDDVTAEQVGEFPSKWDIFQGTVETKTLSGVKAINLTDNAQVQPLIKEQGAYLPEEFTIEYDFYYWPTDKVPGNDDYIGLNDMKLILAVTKDRSEFPQTGGDGGDLTAFVLTHGVCSSSEHTYYFNGDKKGDFTYSFKKGWNHVALSFNKRALKVYFNDKRVVNLPRVNQPTWMCFQVPFD